MKSIIKAFAAFSFASVILLAGCSGGSIASQPSSELLTQATTQEPAEEPTAKEYTAGELLIKSVPEILDILNHDITVESNGKHSYYGSSTGSVCFFNFDILPGFVFSPKGVVYYPNKTDLNDVESDILGGKYATLSFIAVIDGAKLSEDISSDMTYNETAAITGNYATRPPAGQGLITQDLTAYCENAVNASVTYETSREATQHRSNKGYDTEYLKNENPKTMYMIAYKG